MKRLPVPRIVAKKNKPPEIFYLNLMELGSQHTISKPGKRITKKLAPQEKPRNPYNYFKDYHFTKMKNVLEEPQGMFK
jgi:hypothetical protein